MKKAIVILLAAIISISASNAQKLFTRAGYIGFFSDTEMEDIKADNNKVSCVLDAATGQFEFQALMRSFAFEKALMEEHFNENYVESEKFPKSNFKGKVINIGSVNLKADGSYAVKVTGDLTIHGVTKNITVDGMIKVTDGKISCESKFKVNPNDYNITIPDVVKSNISNAIEVTVKCNFEEMKG